MTRSVAECDVLVIGAGPAGSTAAQLLASWGRAVTLIHRPTPAHLTLAESLPASTRKLLGFLGQLERVDAAGFYPNRGNRAEWAGTSRTTTSSDAGFHVAREAFDGVLREGARSAGARTIEASIVRLDADAGVRADAAASDGSTVECRAAYALDCSGRTGVIARRGLRRMCESYNTLAIVAEWECNEWPEDERPYTTIESFADGWAWSVPLSETRRQCTVMVDKKGPGRGLQKIYDEELAKATSLAGRLASARRVSDPWTCDATLYNATRAAEDRALLVGDAASFIEPLSSAGVKKALLSAWRAAVVVNTCLSSAEMAESATDLFVQREREVYSDCLRRSSAFFAEAADFYCTPFWSARAAYHAPASADALDLHDLDDDALARDESIRAAFDRIRAEDGIRLRPADTVRFAPVPTIDGRLVTLREAVLVPGLHAPLQFAAGVDLARLTRIAAACDDVSAIIAAYHDRVGPVPVTGLLTGLSLLVARRALVAEAR